MTAVTPNAHLLKIVPYIAGESVVPGFDNPAKLSSNESPLGPSEAAIEAYKATASRLRRYPDGPATRLRETLAEKHGIAPEHIVCSSGSEELIHLLARSYSGPGDEVLFSQYGFLAYRIAATAAGATPVVAEETNFTANVDALLAAVTPKTRLVYLANPNNPTGTFLPTAEVHRLRDGLPEHVLLVLDAAYSEYVERDDYSAGDELVERGNTVVLRTFSKIYGLGGMRVGWCHSSEEIALVLHRIRCVFNTNLAAQNAAVAAVLSHEHVQRSREHNAKWLPWLTTEFERLGHCVSPSLGNFLLVHFADEAQSQAADSLLRANGIIVRPVANYGLGQCLRVTVGLEHENRQMIDVLEKLEPVAAQA
ncbi:MAG: histidinol-phosphate transaminase [Pseudomonadota bacterium]